MADLLSIILVLFYPFVILGLVFIDFFVLHIARQPMSAYILLILGIIYLIAGGNMYFGSQSAFSVPGIAFLLFGAMQTIWGAYTVRQYQKKPQWGNL